MALATEPYSFGGWDFALFVVGVDLLSAGDSVILK
jgi:hypothetical protein